MSVLNMQPHTLRYSVQGTDGYFDDDGNYCEGDSSWSVPIECSAVPNGSGQERTFSDGVVRSYSYTIHLPETIQDLEIGDKVLLSLYGGKEHEFTVKGFHRYQLQCKCWV